MSDILQQIDVHVHCIQCDEEYTVPASAIAESHRLLDEGCPGSAHECYPSFLASLVEASVLEGLSTAWAAVEETGRRPRVRERMVVTRRRAFKIGAD
ncbi:MAG: hypothetical protein R3B82_20200 [Sandaracinaceae bacterium]